MRRDLHPLREQDEITHMRADAMFCDSLVYAVRRTPKPSQCRKTERAYATG
ncbi:hypothetical protein BZZ08_00445 [Streptomyces sp. MH60]|uniref:hypothetical protein n=1 Tax=Streptomyces sp. MH60 TaxID=1940758 RepID=UPI000D400DF9|nr:hypothetical protein [Streptomyces sp. MH60]PPS90848.1 hypothetical protein BZZ08_00445 [Streptomyces sp. MH60]